MKCEKCGKNEASYFYRENINGRRRELHLCGDCARSEGIANPFEQRGGDLFDLRLLPDLRALLRLFPWEAGVVF